MGKDAFLDMTMCTWNVLDKMTTSSSRDCRGERRAGLCVRVGAAGFAGAGHSPQTLCSPWEVTGRPPDKQADKRRQEAALETCRQEVRAEQSQARRRDSRVGEQPLLAAFSFPNK